MPAEDRFKNILEGAESDLLVHCARLKIDRSCADHVKTVLATPPDWNRLLRLAHRNGLTPLLSLQLERVAPELVPPDRLKQLRERFQNNAALNVLLTAEIVRLIQLFERNGIDAIPYKGAALAAGIYGDLSLRQFSDLDILIRETDLWKATELLQAEDYRAHFVIPERKRAQFTQLGYVRLFKRERDETPVELHWRLAPRFFGCSLEFESLWQRSRTLELQNVPVRIPSSEDLLLMLCIHAAKDCWEKLEWVCSLAELLRTDSEIDWQSLIARAEANRCLAVVSIGLLLAHDLLDAPLPEPLAADLRHQTRLRRIANQVVKRFFSDEAFRFTLMQRTGFHLQLKDARIDQWRYCWRLATTTTPVDWEVTPLPRAASFLYYPLRAFRLIRKYGWQHQRTNFSKQINRTGLTSK